MNAALPPGRFRRRNLERAFLAIRVPPEPNGIDVPKWSCCDHLRNGGTK